MYVCMYSSLFCRSIVGENKGLLFLLFVGILSILFVYCSNRCMRSRPSRTAILNRSFSSSICSNLRITIMRSALKD